MKIEIMIKTAFVSLLLSTVSVIATAENNGKLASIMKQTLDQSPLGCGLHEGELSTQEKHLGPIEHFVSHIDSSSSIGGSVANNDVIDTIETLVVGDEEVKGYKILILIEALGELNGTEADSALRSIYNNEKAIAKRMVPVDTNSDIAEAVFNSNVEDINIAIIAAISRSESESLNDIVNLIAETNGAAAEKAKLL